MTARLLDLYEHDPDAGIHGASGGPCGSGSSTRSSRTIAARLRGKHRGGRRWYVNSQGQTFAIIEGPLEFRMGSPANEPGRYGNEPPHQQVIPRRFAIADKEVTVEQYQEFAEGEPRRRSRQHRQVQPGPDRPDERSDMVSMPRPIATG